MAGDMEQQRTANVVLTADVDPYRQSVQAAAQDTSRLSDRVDKLARSLDQLTKSAGRKLTLFGAGSTAGITASTIAFAAFDKQMTALKVNAEVTGRSYDKMTRSVNGLRREFGVATSSAVELNRAVLTFSDRSKPVDSLTKTFVRLGAAVGEAPEAMAQGMLQLQRSMGTSQRDTNRYANVLTDLSVKSGVAASSILQFSQTIAPIGRIAGMQQAEIMGVATAFNKAGQDGYYAANAFNAMLSDIMKGVQNGSPELAKYANLIGVTVEQFKGMNKTTAITEVFDELNRLGPNAIQILNRMGLDGMRMQRAIAGVSQQSGGIGASVAQAVAAYNDPSGGALRGGSDVALDGVADRMKRLSESTKQMGEAMGAAFQGPAKAFLSVMQKIVSTIADLAGSTGGKVIAWVGGLAAVAALAAGPLLKFATVLGSMAMGRQVMTNWVTQGYMDRRNARLGNGALLSPSGVRMATEGGTNVAQRALYRFGNERLGTVLPPMTVSRTLGVAPWAMAHGMNIWRSTLGGLTHPFDPGARPRLLATDAERAAGSGWGPRGVFSGSMIAGAASSSGVGRAAFASRRLTMLPGNALSQMVGNASQHWLQSPGFGAPLAAQMGFMGRSAMAMTGSLGAAAGGVAGIAGRAGLGALRGATGLFSSLGPLGAAMIGIPAAMAVHSSLKGANSLEGKVGEGADNLSLMNAYKAAVGDATSATNSFAAALNRATVESKPTTKEQAMIVSEQDKTIAMQQKGFTDKRIKDISRSQAQNLLAGEIAAGASPADIQALKIDLLKRFGANRTDVVEDILANSDRKGATFNMGQYVNEIDKSSGFGGKTWLGLKSDKTTESQYRLLEGQLDSAKTAALAQGGSAAAGEVQKVFTNQFLTSFFKNYDSKTSGETGRGASFIDRTLFGGKLDIGHEADGLGSLNKLVDFQQFAVNMGEVAEAFEKSPVKGLSEFYGQALDSDDKRTTEGINTVLNNYGMTRKQARTQIAAGRGSLFNDDMGVAKLLAGSTVTPAEMTKDRIFSTDAGKIFQGDKKVMASIDAAVAAPDNQNAQITAIDDMVRALKKSGASFGEIQRTLIQFQAAVQSTSDPLYQLAAGARAVSQQNLQFKIPYMGRADQFGAIAEGYANKMVALRPDRAGAPLTPDALTERKNVKAEFEQYKLNTRNVLMQQVVQQREFNIARERSNYDFYQVQLPRMEEQYALSRERSWEDYNISRQRSEEEFNISRARSAQQFAISNKDAYFDFHLSRKRAEEDFAHQQVLLAKQAAQGMYNVYQRVMVQRTWSGPSLLMNSEDQLDRMRQQNQDLDKVRKMGLSKAAIQQLGFTDAANQQQLARFIEDAMSNPAIVAKFNKNAQGRLKAGKKLATDPANPQWEEMRRQFELTMDRGADDFGRAMGRNRRNYRISMSQSQADFARAMDNNAVDMKRAMARSATDYATALDHMKSDYTRLQDRAARDLKRSQKELTWSFNETLEKALKMLTGSARDQAEQIKEVYLGLKAFLAANEIELIVNWKNQPGKTQYTDPLDRSNSPANPENPRRTSAYGGLYSGSTKLTVGEKNTEMVLPLNSQGADFVAALLHRYSGDAQKMRVSGNSIPVGNNATYNYRVDSSTNFTGPVQVSGVENPRELAEKARMEARRKKLTTGVRK